MPTLESSTRGIEDRKAAPSTHPFETVRPEPAAVGGCESTAALWLVAFMIAAIVVCGVVLWMKVNS